MSDIKRLEDEWVQYNKNKKKPLYFFIALISAVFFISIFFLKDSDITFPEISNPFSVDKYKNNNDKYDTILIHKELHELQMNEIEIIEEVKPIVDLDINENTDDIPTLPIVKNIPILDDAPVIKRKIHKKPLINIVTSDIAKPELPRKKIHLNIIESSSVSAYKDVEKRFRQSHDTDDSIFLAKSYFRKGQYEKSEFWALETNRINPNIEESWLIFVKSKVKLGRKYEAIRILTNYAKKSNSSEAWNLLLKLKK